MKTKYSKYYVVGNRIKKRPNRIYDFVFYAAWLAAMAYVILTK